MSKADILKGKMPVTMLQEMCFKLKSTLPMYEYIGEEVSPHNVNVKVFTYRVSAMGKQAIGIGRSKQDAKHESAWQLIRLALELPPGEEDELVATAAEERGSLAAHELGIDRVNQVRDICVQRNFPLPEFELVRNYGPSHAPVFEYECRIRDIVRRGTHSTKKGAKQIACQEMIKTLQSMPVEEHGMQMLSLDQAINEVEESNENVIRTYREYTQSDNKKELGVSIADRHNFFLRLSQERIDEARQLLLDANLSMREKCERIAPALGLKAKTTMANSNMLTIKGGAMNTYELVNPDYDCLIFGEGEKLFNNVVNYFVSMLNCQPLYSEKDNVMADLTIEPLAFLKMDDLFASMPSELKRSINSDKSENGKKIPRLS